MRAPLIAIMLSTVSAAVCAQSADQTVTGLKACFELARGADAICAKPENDAVQRLDCLQKARTAQLECLAQIPPETSAGYAPAEKIIGAGKPEKPSGTASAELSAGTVSVDKPTAAISTDRPARAVPSRATGPNWVVSQTTSPIDYSPLITAAIRLPVSAKHAPDTLAIRCRGRRTELLVRTGGTWRASRAGEVRIEYQINDQSVVKQRWTASADGRTAIYKDDAVEFLQSLPEGAQLKINVLDGPEPGQEATFQLAGLDAVREKIAAACSWAPVTSKVSSEKH
jgi:Type VI secretion system VasI, EvfG, VC_A0118